MASPVELVQIDLTPRRPQSKPAWLKAHAPLGDNYHDLKKLARMIRRRVEGDPEESDELPLTRTGKRSSGSRR
jgi:hypothetical protein